MATTIKSIPVLTGQVAASFQKKAKASLAKKRTVNFSSEQKNANAILKKADFQGL